MYAGCRFVDALEPSSVSAWRQAGRTYRDPMRVALQDRYGVPRHPIRL